MNTVEAECFFCKKLTTNSVGGVDPYCSEACFKNHMESMFAGNDYLAPYVLLDSTRLPMFRVIGREHWTKEDHKEWARRYEANEACYKQREQALIAHGWELHFKRCSLHVGGEWALDPVTGRSCSHKDAYRLQEERVHGSIPAWPVFDNDWEPPTSKCSIQVHAIQLQPMTVPTGSIFYHEFRYGNEDQEAK